MYHHQELKCHLHTFVCLAILKIITDVEGGMYFFSITGKHFKENSSLKLWCLTCA